MRNTPSEILQWELWTLEAKILAINAAPPHQQTAQLKQLSIELQRKYRRAVRNLDNIKRIEQVGSWSYADLDSQGLLPRAKR